MSGSIRSQVSLFLGPLLALVTYFTLDATSSLGHEAILVAAITLWCATWWIGEPVPIPVSSLIPLATLPLLGILSPNQVAEAYGNPLILLLLGGAILSMAMEKSGTHKHIALAMLHLFGTGSARRVVLGFMAAAAVLSMWISNAATTLMLLPVALAVVSSSEDKRIAVPLLLGLCYGASIGGMGTPIGTPPNLIFMKVYEDSVGESISFFQWMSWCLPIVMVFVPVTAWWLTRNLSSGGSEPQRFVLPESGRWTIEQKRVMAVFGMTAFFWVTRTEPFGGWRALLDLPKANDASVALIAVVVMFLVPNGKGGRLLDWETANRIPWGMLLLFSGGIALAKAFVATGLAEALANGITGFATLPTILMILLICLSVTFLTEVTSNTASTSLLMPVLAMAAVTMKVDPLLLMVPAALSASCAFMLPVATAPNAIVFGSNQVPIVRMVRAGLMLNFIGAVVITLGLLRLGNF